MIYFLVLSGEDLLNSVKVIVIKSTLHVKLQVVKTNLGTDSGFLKSYQSYL